MKMGKMMENIKDILRLLPKISATQPAVVGPRVQPISPASASNANIFTPPFEMRSVAIQMVPGHIIPTEKPHKAQPTSESRGYGERAASK